MEPKKAANGTDGGRALVARTCSRKFGQRALFLNGLLLALAALCLLLSNLERTDATKSEWAAAPVCCIGCTYQASCCCAKRDSVPVTKTVYAHTRTKTTIKTFTKTISARLAARSGSQDVEAALVANYDEGGAGSDLLVARHLCPRCPAGVQLSRTGSQSAVYCCPARKTVTKTLAKTKLTTITKHTTKTVTKTNLVRLKGQVYYDDNGNGVFDKGIDVPIANTMVVLVNTAKKVRAGATVYGHSITNGQGFFDILSLPLPKNTAVALTKENETNTPLKTFQTKPDGSVDVDVAVDRRAIAQPVVTPPVSIANNIATVTGTGEPGLKIYLYANGVRVGETVVDGSGNYVVSSSSKITSGSKALTITQADDRAAETKPVTAGAVTILSPPVLVSKSVSGPVATVVGTGKAGATVKLYADNGTPVGTATVAPNGSWTISTTPLFLGAHLLTCTQEDSSGVSDPADFGSITIQVKATSTTAGPAAGKSTTAANKMTSSQVRTESQTAMTTKAAASTQAVTESQTAAPKTTSLAANSAAITASGGQGTTDALGTTVAAGGDPTTTVAVQTTTDVTTTQETTTVPAGGGTTLTSSTSESKTPWTSTSETETTSTESQTVTTTISATKRSSSLTLSSTSKTFSSTSKTLSTTSLSETTLSTTTRPAVPTTTFTAACILGSNGLGNVWTGGQSTNTNDFDRFSDGTWIVPNDATVGMYLVAQRANGEKYAFAEVPMNSDGTMEMINSVNVDDYDNVYLGTQHGSLYKYARNGTLLGAWNITIPEEPGYTASIRGPIGLDASNNLIMAVGQGNSATPFGQLYMFNTTSQKFTTLRNTSQIQADTGVSNVYVPVGSPVDRSRGIIYIVQAEVSTSQKPYRYYVNGTGFAYCSTTGITLSSTMWSSIGIDQSTGELWAQLLLISPGTYNTYKWSAGCQSAPTLWSTTWPSSTRMWRVVGGDIWWSSVSARLTPVTDTVPTNQSYVIKPFDYPTDLVPMGYPYTTFVARYGAALYRITLDSTLPFGAYDVRLPIAGLSSDTGLTYDYATNMFYVVSSSGTQIDAIDGTTFAVTTLATGFTSLTRLDVGPTGDVFAIDGADIKKVTPAGVKSTIASGFTINNGISDAIKPTTSANSIAVDSAGNVFISTYGYVKFNASAPGTPVASQIVKLASGTWSSSVFHDFGTTGNFSGDQDTQVYVDADYALQAFYSQMPIAIEGTKMLVMGYSWFWDSVSSMDGFYAASTSTTSWSPQIITGKLMTSSSSFSFLPPVYSPRAVLGLTGYLFGSRIEAQCLL